MGTPIEDAIQTMATKRGISADDLRAVLMDAVKARGSDSAARETIRQFFEDREPTTDERMAFIASLMKLDMDKSAKDMTASRAPKSLKG